MHSLFNYLALYLLGFYLCLSPAWSTTFSIQPNNLHQGRELIMDTFLTNPTKKGLVYTGFQTKFIPLQTHTSIPNVLASFGGGYRHCMDSNRIVGGYLFLDQGIDAHLKMKKLLKPLREKASFAIAQLLQSWSLQGCPPHCLAIYFLNLNVGFEFIAQPWHIGINFYQPLSTHNLLLFSSAPLSYIEATNPGGDIKIAYTFLNYLTAFWGIYGFYSTLSPPLIGVTFGAETMIHHKLSFRAKYTIDQLRGQTASITLRYQCLPWLSFSSKYTYDVIQGHQLSPSNLGGILFAFRWDFGANFSTSNNITPQNKLWRPIDRHLSPLFLQAIRNENN